MKNLIRYALLFVSFFVFSSFVYALETTEVIMGRVVGESVRFRSAPDASDSSNVLTRLYVGDKVEVLNKNAGTGNGCELSWYYVKYNDIEGYLCSEWVRIINDSFVSSEFNIEDWPTEYREYVFKIHEEFPNFVLLPLNTGLDFYTAVYNFSKNDKSLIYYTLDVGYRSVSSKSYNYKLDEFYYDKNEGSRWYYASYDTVAYYLDPRNFLNETNIFMFEDLSYNTTLHTKQGVEKILTGSFVTSSALKDKYVGYQDWFMEAASTYNVSPIHLAARVRQEIGSGSIAATGEPFTYTKDGKTYNFSGLYNLFNIGAYGYSPPAIAGLVNANGGVDGSNKNCGRPWVSPYKSILGGACTISSGYSSKGQQTLYLQRFNVNPDAANAVYTHSYMTNISAHLSESSSSYKAYAASDSLNQEITFLIPVYLNMPKEKVSLPNRGNPNNYLSDIRINNISLEEFDGDKVDYEVIVSELTNKVSISGTTVNANATISGIGDYDLTDMETTITLVVTAQNKAVRKYNVKIVKDDSKPLEISDILDNMGIKYNDKYISGISSGVLSSNIIDNVKKLTLKANAVINDEKGVVKTNSSLVTGDKFIINSNDKSQEFIIVVTGDNNGDGEVSLIDLLRTQKYLLGASNLDDKYMLASDVNGDGNVDLVDLLRIQKYLLGYIDKL